MTGFAKELTAGLIYFGLVCLCTVKSLSCSLQCVMFIVLYFLVANMANRTMSERTSYAVQHRPASYTLSCVVPDCLPRAALAV